MSLLQAKKSDWSVQDVTEHSSNHLASFFFEGTSSFQTFYQNNM